MDIVNNVIVAMSNDLTSDQLNKLSNVLRLQLAIAEKAERGEELMISEDGWIRQLTLFLATKKLQNCADSTLEQYERAIKMMIGQVNKPLADITTNDLRAYLAWYQETRNISMGYLDTLRLYFSSFFGWLHNEGMIQSNPASRLNRIRAPEKIQEPYSATELETIRDHCTTARDRALVELMYSTAARIGEVCSINRDDVDFQRNEIIIYGTKGKKERRVYLTDKAAYYLKKYLISRGDQDPALFVGLRSPHRRITKDGVEAMLRKIGDETGIHVHPHRFRRTMLTEQGKRGMPLQEIQTYAGHQSPTTTMRYITVSDEAVRNSFKKYIA